MVLQNTTTINQKHSKKSLSQFVSDSPPDSPILEHDCPMNEFKCRGNLTTICDDEDDNQHDHDYHDDHHGQWLTKSHEKDF